MTPPLRRIVDSKQFTEATGKGERVRWFILDTLECGHTVRTYRQDDIQSRRCVDCPPVDAHERTKAREKARRR